FFVSYLKRKIAEKAVYDLFSLVYYKVAVELYNMVIIDELTETSDTSNEQSRTRLFRRFQLFVSYLKRKIAEKAVYDLFSLVYYK
ncbi:hypothetical protein HAX54_053268, partial [Datura stramonium]|nr:hypothetical protein [Datura stramonium]